jgi:hypothetical protein
MTAAAATVSDQPEPHRPAHRAGCQRATAARVYPQLAEAFEQGRAPTTSYHRPDFGTWHHLGRKSAPDSHQDDTTTFNWPTSLSRHVSRRRWGAVWMMAICACCRRANAPGRAHGRCRRFSPVALTIRSTLSSTRCLLTSVLMTGGVVRTVRHYHQVERPHGVTEVPHVFRIVDPLGCIRKGEGIGV